MLSTDIVLVCKADFLQEEGEGESLVERRPRPVSVTNVRALFDGQGGYPRVEDSGLGFANPLGFVDTRRMPDLWHGPTSVVSPPTSLQAGSELIVTQQPATRTENETSKRGSDPLIEEKVRQASTGGVPSHQPRAVSARTQSLDITSLNFTRSLSNNNQSPFGPMPPSPSGITSSPNTATGQYFPGGSGNVNGNGNGNANGNGNGKGNYGNFDASVDGVTQGSSRAFIALRLALLIAPTGLSNVQVSHQ